MQEPAKEDLRRMRGSGLIGISDWLFQAMGIRMGRDMARLVREWLWNWQRKVSVACPG